MKKKNRNPSPAAENSPAAATAAPPPAFEAVVLSEKAVEDAPDGYPFALVPLGDGDKRPMPELSARITITAKIRPHDLVRTNGKWFMEFSILSPDSAPGEGATGPIFGVEVGGAESSLTFEDAARFLCGA